MPLGDLLAKAGFVANKTTQRKMLRSYLQVEGTDKYWVVYSLTEVEGSEHDGRRDCGDLDGMARAWARTAS